MPTLLTLFGLSLFCSLCLTWVVRSLAVPWGLTDKPDQRRKLHSQNIPVAGGVAVLLASLASLVTVLLLDLCPWREQFQSPANHWLGLALASILIVAVGVFDDLGRLRGRHKLLGQLLAVGIIIATGLVVKSIRIGDLDLELGPLAIPFTAFFLLGAINSLNLLDGMDGMLSTVGLIIALAFTGMAVMGDKWPTACVAVTMAGALLGFLRYNFPPASIFLGDSGSMLIGLVIGSLAIQSSLKGPAAFALTAPVAILAIPILDTMAAIFRRKLTGRSIYTTDRGHLHHCLLRQGFSKVTVLFFVSLFCLVAVAGAYLSITLNSEWLALLAAFLVAVVLARLGWFGRGELHLISNRLKGLIASFFQFRKPVRPHNSAIRLQGSGAWADLWANLTQAAEDMALKTVRLDINAPALHESYNGRWVNHGDENAEDGVSGWNLAIPLVWCGQTVGRLEVSGNRDTQTVVRKISRLSKLVEELELHLCKIADDAGLPLRELIAVGPRSAQPLLKLTAND